MATAEQIKALLKSHADHDDQRFYSIALQVAAKEARKGHHKLASELKETIERSQKASKSLTVAPSKPTPLAQHPKGDLKGLLELTHSTARKNELVLSSEVSERLDKVLLEQRQKAAWLSSAFPQGANCYLPARRAQVKPYRQLYWLQS